MAMVPHERSLVQRLLNKPFALLGVNVDPSKEDLKEAQEKHNITWRSWSDGRHRIASKYKVDRYPTMILINHKGIIRQTYLGNPGDKVLEQDVMKVIKEAEDDRK
jgi:peroxiredoxin